MQLLKAREPLPAIKQRRMCDCRGPASSTLRLVSDARTWRQRLAALPLLVAAAVFTDVFTVVVLAIHAVLRYRHNCIIHGGHVSIWQWGRTVCPTFNMEWATQSVVTAHAVCCDGSHARYTSSMPLSHIATGNMQHVQAMGCT